MTNFTIFSTISFSLFILLVQGGLREYPSDQPGCPHCYHGEIFYRVHAERKKTAEDNWVCEESFENKLKICITMFKTISGRKLTSTYELLKDKESVNRECEEQQVTFFEPMNKDNSEIFDPTETTIGVWMFRCPITKIHLQFPSTYAFPPKEIIEDFYITKGKVDDSPIVAVLKNSSYVEDNICLKDLYIFDYQNVLASRNMNSTK